MSKFTHNKDYVKRSNFGDFGALTMMCLHKPAGRAHRRQRAQRRCAFVCPPTCPPSCPAKPWRRRKLDLSFVALAQREGRRRKCTRRRGSGVESRVENERHGKRRIESSFFPSTLQPRHSFPSTLDPLLYSINHAPARVNSPARAAARVTDQQRLILGKP